MAREPMRNGEKREEKHQSNQQSIYLAQSQHCRCGTGAGTGIHKAAGTPTQKMNLANLRPIPSLQVLPSLWNGDNLHCPVQSSREDQGDWRLKGLARHDPFHRRKVLWSLEELLPSEDEILLRAKLEACILWTHKSIQEPNSAVSCPTSAWHHSTQKDRVRHGLLHRNHMP